MAARYHLFSVSTVVLLGWGALAFGAEYSWAYAPLLVFSLVVGVLGLLASRGSGWIGRPLWLGLVVVVVAVLLQLVPLPRRAVTTISPAAVATPYRQLYATETMRPVEAAMQADEASVRPLSIAPSRTVLGLTFLTALGILLAGCARGIGTVGPRGIARGILVLGVLVALLELIQRSSGSYVVYGLWYPPKVTGNYSAPFINRDHTAGWLVMALSLSMGYFAGGLARGLRGTTPDWRHRVLWFSTSQAQETVLAGVATVVMAIAIILTASRSGLLCLAFAVGLSGWWMVRRQSSRSRRIVAVGYLAAVVVLAASWGRIDVVLGRFDSVARNARIQVWQDTASIIRDFPFAGTGLNTYGIAMLHYQTLQNGLQFIEAHNDYLQLAAEGGLLLGIPVLVTLFLFVREVRRRFREGLDDTMTYWLRAGAVTGLCAIALQAMFDFTLQMPGAAVLFVVLAAIAVHKPYRSHTPRSGEPATQAVGEVYRHGVAQG